MVFAELACVGSTDSNTVCALCGMTVADLPFVSDYFDVIMKSRPSYGRRAAIPPRALAIGPLAWPIPLARLSMPQSAPRRSSRSSCLILPWRHAALRFRNCSESPVFRETSISLNPRAL